MTRPPSVTLTALILAWFGIASIAAAAMGAFGSGPGLPLPTLLTLALALFGLTSTAAARALWTMRPAGSRLLLAVGGAGVFLAIAMPIALGSQVDTGKAWTGGLVGAGGLALLCTWQSRRFAALLARAV